MKCPNGLRVVAICMAAVFAAASIDALADARRPLKLKTQGIFWAGGRIVNRTQPGLETNKILVGQAYVEYFIPQDLPKNPIPLILTHASQSGVIWRTTPDGREGWAEWFLRHNFPVYVIDPPGRGRAGGYDVDPINLAATGKIPPLSTNPLNHNDSGAWANWHNGPEFGVQGDGSTFGNQMPINEESLKHWLAHQLPGTPYPGPSESQSAFVAVLERVKAQFGTPAVWIGWSGGATLGENLVIARPDLFRAYVALEPSLPGCTAAGTAQGPPPPAVVEVFAKHKIPFLNINSRTGHAEFGGESRTHCQELVNAIVAAGGNARNVYLPDLGISGDSHMMMWEKHSDEIAQVALDWLKNNTKKPGQKP